MTSGAVFWLIVSVSVLGAWSTWITARLRTVEGVLVFTTRIVRLACRYHGPELRKLARTADERLFLEAVRRSVENEKGTDE